MSVFYSAVVMSNVSILKGSNSLTMSVFYSAVVVN